MLEVLTGSNIGYIFIDEQPPSLYNTRIGDMMRFGRKGKKGKPEMPDLTLEQAVELALDQNLSFEMGIFAFETERNRCSMTRDDSRSFAGLRSVDHYFERFERAKASLKLKKVSLYVDAMRSSGSGLQHWSRTFTSEREYQKWLNTAEGRDVKNGSPRWRFYFER